MHILLEETCHWISLERVGWAGSGPASRLGKSQGITSNLCQSPSLWEPTPPWGGHSQPSSMATSHSPSSYNTGDPSLIHRPFHRAQRWFLVVRWLRSQKTTCLSRPPDQQAVIKQRKEDHNTDLHPEERAWIIHSSPREELSGPLTRLRMLCLLWFCLWSSLPSLLPPLEVGVRKYIFLESWFRA